MIVKTIEDFIMSRVSAECRSMFLLILSKAVN